MARARGLKKDLRVVERAVRHGVKGLEIQPGPGQVVDVVLNRAQRLERIRADDRPDKRWRMTRDSILRPLVPGPIKLVARLFGRRRRRGR